MSKNPVTTQEELEGLCAHHGCAFIPPWTSIGQGLYIRKGGTLWVALTPGQAAWMRNCARTYDLLGYPLQKGYAEELDDGSIVIQVRGVLRL